MIPGMRDVRGHIVGFVLLISLGFSSAASAGAPMTLLLDRDSGSGQITLSATTKRLHETMWLYLANPSTVAHGKATLSCRTKQPHGATATIQWFKFEIKARARQEVWRYGSKTPCTISVSLSGPGTLSGSLRGF
jgi:hypothetical protein